MIEEYLNVRAGMKKPSAWKLTAVATALALVAAGAPVAEAGLPLLPETKPGRGVRVSELPLLRSDPVEEQAPELGQPSGMWSTARSQETPRSGPAHGSRVVGEVESRRVGNARLFELEDGSLVVDEYTTPIHYQGDDGGWRRIDTTLRPVPGRPGWVGTAGNSWSAAFGQVSQGFELSSDGGVVSVVPVFGTGGTAKATVSPEVSLPRLPVGPFRPDDLLAQSAVPLPSKVQYRSAVPGVDLVYDVRGDAVKETILLNDPAAGHEFAFEITGTELSLRADGSVGLSGPVGERFSIPAPTVLAADGSDVTGPSGVHYELRDANGAAPGSQLVVSVDAEWLATDGAALLPLAIDPTFDEYQTTAVSYSNLGDTYSGPGFQLGRDSTGRVWRGGAHFSGYECCLTGGYRAYSAFVELYRLGGEPGSTAIGVYEQGDQPTSWSQIGAGSGTIINTLEDPPPNPIYPLSTWTYDTVDDWLRDNEADQWFGFRGTESGVTVRQYDARLYVSLFKPPAESEVTNIDNDEVLATTTPVLQAEAVPMADDGLTQPSYTFQITTAPTPGSGLVLSGYVEGGTDPSWQVPPGALEEGVTYYAWVLTDWTKNPGSISKVESSSRRFTVDLGLGEGGPSPTDSVGAVPGSASSPAEAAPGPSLPASKLTVNLVNGNLSTALGSKAMGTLSGGISLGFTYNSLTVNSQGLRAEYFNDTNGNGQINDGTDLLVAERVDPTVSFGWGSTSTPVAAQDPNKALARWTGALTLPAGTWELGAVSSDGLRITSGSTVLLDRWSSHEPESAPVFGPSFTASAGMPIKIEWRNSSGQALAHVVARQYGAAVYDLSPAWLTRSPKALPPGWTLNGDAASAQWVGLADRGRSVSLFAADGSAHEFKAAGNGVYTSPETAPTDLVSLGDNGRFVVQTAAGQVYTFRSDGVLESLVNAADDLNPAALEYGYSGSPLRMRTVRDRVTNRTVNLSYGGDGPCGAVPAAATGLLCQIAYWDSTVSTLVYDSSGRLTRLIHPGDVVYDLAYNSAGLLKSVRDPLAAAAVAAGVRADDATVLTEISYSGGKVDKVTQPAPALGAARPERDYSYSSDKGEVDVAGFTPPIGFAERLGYDDRKRITKRTDSAGLITIYTWDAKDRVVATTDPAGLRTTTHYDHHSRPTHKYGPAPSSSFDANGYPVSGATVPLTTTSYDGGIVGLAAVYWTNPKLAGPPSLRRTGLGAGGEMNRDWNLTPPVTPGPEGWSARFSGDLNVTAADDYTWRALSRGSLARVWVDDVLVVDNTQPEPAAGWTTTTGTARSLTAGPHKIRVDLVDGSGPAGLQVLWSRTGAPAFVTVPGTALGPNYGLVTAATDPDGKTVATEYSDPAVGIGPEHRTPTATVADPAGANLRTAITYEAPGAGSFLRRVARTLPAGNTTTNTNYGPTEGPTGSAGAAAVAPRASTAAGNTVASTLAIPTPTGVSSGDVLVAAVGVRGGSSVTVTPPPGWSLIRTDNSTSSTQLSSYWRAAGPSEPPSHTWNFTSSSGSPTSKAAAGTVTAYTGADPISPIDGHGGAPAPSPSVSVVAPSVTTTVSNARVVGLFTIASSSGITPPAGLTELAEANSSVSGQSHITTESADTTQASAGATGAKTATGGSAVNNVGQLVALRPAAVGACGLTSTTPQGGRPKRVTGPDPDGTGTELARVEEFLYDTIGRPTGRRVGTTATVSTAGWGCTTYDAKGRISSQTWPATGAAPGRTVTYQYAVGGNPLVNAVTDSDSGGAAVQSTVDLLGRVVSYRDLSGDTTANQYDRAGRVVSTDGPGGNRSQAYTPDGRPGALTVDGSAMSTPIYEPTTGRLSSVAYANGTTNTFTYDTFGRAKSVTTANGTGPIAGDQVTFSRAGRVEDQSVYTASGWTDANPTGPNYAYDPTGRLTEAKVPGVTYGYGYGVNGACSWAPAGLNANRTTRTVTSGGASTTSNCYDQADRLTSSTDEPAGAILYDTHGNTTGLGGKTLDFDAADRHTRTETPATVTRYGRDPLDRISTRSDMTRITFVASSAATAAGTSVTVARPAGTQAGDLVVAALTIAEPGPTLSAPGWNVAISQTQGSQRTWALWRYATATDDPAWGLGSDGATSQLTAALATYRGPNATAPVAVTATGTVTASSTHPLPALTTASDANQLVYIVGFNGNVTATTPAGVDSRTAQPGGVSVMLADRFHSRPSTSLAGAASTATPVSSASLTLAVLPATTTQRLGYAGHSDSPSHLDDATGTLVERYVPLPGGVSVTQKPTTQTATLFTDDFATNGPTWPKWATTSNDAAKTADITGNQGRLYVNSSSARATASMNDVADSDTTLTYRFNDRNFRSYLRIMARGTGASSPSSQMQNGYRIEIRSDSNSVKLQSYVNGTATHIDSFTGTQDTDAQKLRIQVIGNTVRVKAWPASLSTEPPTWQLDKTDGTITGTGGLQINHNYDTGARNLYIDDVTVTAQVPLRSWSYTNLHGDTIAVADNAGTRSWIGWNGPYGELASGNGPTNSSAPGTTWGWHGNQLRLTDRDLTHLGARPYSPSIGRFLAVDPIEGGCPNDYVYVSDPVNHRDLNGTQCPHGLKRAAGFLSISWVGKMLVRLHRGDPVGALDAAFGGAIASGATSGNGAILNGIASQAIGGRSFASIVSGRIIRSVGSVFGKLGGLGVGIPAMGVEAICELQEPADTMELAPGANFGSGGTGI